MIKHLLIATNGLYESLGAVRFAHSLQERLGVRVDALGVVEPVSLLMSGAGESMGDVEPVQASALAEALEARVRRQLNRISELSESWPLTFRRGSVAPTIAEVAAQLNVDMVVIGLTREEGFGGFFSREMIVRLTHLLHVPVVAVPAGLARLHTAVAAIDFTPVSLRAAYTLASLLPQDATLHLACVIENASSVEEATAHARLGEVAAALIEDGKFAIRSHVLAGNPSDEILRLVRRVGADVVASGSHGAGFMSRTVMGGVAERLLHDTPCSILVAPPRQEEELGLDLSDEETVQHPGGAVRSA
jgi:nucleotide-binding universal stress UspA family protein